MTGYLDPSFLVSLYSSDDNFEAAVRTMQTFQGQRLVTTFGTLEVINAFGLRVFRKQVKSSQAQSSLDDFEKDLRAGVLQVCPLPEQVLSVLVGYRSRQPQPWGRGRRISSMSRLRWSWAWIASSALTSSSGNWPKPYG